MGGAVYVPPGLIGLPCGELGRYSAHNPTVVAMRKPEGTGYKYQPGLGVAAPLNEIGKAFLANPKWRWLLITNDDHAYPIQTIPALWRALADPYNPFDAVSGLYSSRRIPFEPVAFDRVEPWPDDAEDRHILLSDRHYLRYFNKPDDNTGTIPMVAVGDGCLMIKRAVLETIPYPWWEYGETVRGSCDHDIMFSRKMRDYGFRIGLNLDLRVDHLTPFRIRPEFNPDTGEWLVILTDEMGNQIVLPGATREHPAVAKGKEGK